MRAAGENFGIYAAKQLKNAFFALAASYTFLSFTLVYRVLVAMHKTHFNLFWPAAAKKIGFKYNKNSWKVGELTSAEKSRDWRGISFGDLEKSRGISANYPLLRGGN